MPESQHTEHKQSWRKEAWGQGIERKGRFGINEGKGSVETLDEKLDKRLDETTPKTTPKKILVIRRENPSCERSELAETLGITIDGVKYHLNRLRATGHIKDTGLIMSGLGKRLK